MYRDQSVSVVVPCYNEESQITRVIDTMPDYVDWIVIVNDKSEDRTSEIVRGHPLFGSGRIVLIDHEINQGVGGAIATGYKWSRDNNIDIAAVMAGDAQMDPDDLPALLDPIVDDLVDYVKGNRLVTGEAFKKIPKIRYFGNAMLSFMTKISSGYWRVADSQTGYTTINAQALQDIDWDQMFKRYGQPNDLLVKLNVANFRVVDVPVTPVYNVGEKSGIRIRRVIFTIGGLLIRDFFWRVKEKYIIRDFHPLVFFYAFSAFALLVSSAFFIRLCVLWYQNGVVPELTLISWLFALAMGFNSLFFAMWFDYEANRHLNPPLLYRDVRRRSQPDGKTKQAGDSADLGASAPATAPQSAQPSEYTAPH